MLDDNALVEVRNISAGVSGYSIPELSMTRRFAKGEMKKIPARELRALQFTPGGEILMKEYLSVDNKELLEEFHIDPAPEYFWTEEEVKDLLLNGSLARLQDCLDFAPIGIVDMVKDLAVALELNDMSKRHAIFEATGFNVTNAILINQIDAADRESSGEKSSTRRVPITE